MKVQKQMSMAIILCFLITGIATAADNPETLIKTVAEVSQLIPVTQKSPEQRWQNFLNNKGWDKGLSEGGVIIVPRRELIISSASAFTKVRLGQPGWVESRVAAFEQAEMEAKTKIIRYLAETVDVQRSLKMLEHAVWQDGDVNKVKNLNEVAETLKRIGKKALILTESKLDNVLQKIDPDYDPAKYDNKSVEELQVIAEDMFNRQVKAVAMKTLIGVTQLYSAEDAVGTNEYQVLVGVIWSPNLNRLAMSLFNDEYNIPLVSPGQRLSEQIPADDLALLGTMGTRIVIDENGQYAVMAYGQAQPRHTSSSRRQAAVHQAKQIAANRARGQIVNFIREGMILHETELSDELSQEFSDDTIGTQTLRDYQKSIQGKRVKVKLRGLRVLKEWSMEHPLTTQPVAGAVVAWSPASADLSKQADETMQVRANKQMSKGAAQKNRKSAKSSVAPDLESINIDTSAY